MSIKKNIAFFFIVFFLSGCSKSQPVPSHILALTEDHSIGIVSTPLSAPGMLLWRIITFTEQSLSRLHLRLVKFPLLEDKKLPPIDPDRRTMNPFVMNAWLKKNVGQPLAGNIDMYITGEHFFPRVEKAILGASKSIKISIYIFDNDRYAYNFATLLKKKSSQVPVKLLSDQIASMYVWNRSDKKSGTPWESGENIFDYLAEDSRVRVRRSRNQWFTSEHSKVLVVDGSQAFFGGMNIGDEYRYTWRDAMFGVEGELAYAFERYFDNSWLRYGHLSDVKFLIKTLFHKGKNRKKRGAIPCHLLRTTPVRHEIYNAQIKAAQSAKHHIYVENPYIWNQQYLYELCAARKKGVDVRVTLPEKFDMRVFEGINKKVVNILMAHGVRVFIYPGMTHVKAAVYDGWACFGTANYDDLSFHKNYEINLGTADPGFVKKLEKDLLLQGQKRSRELKKPFKINPMDSFTYELKDYL